MKAFADFWALYPRHVAKIAAEKAWLKIVRTHSPAAILMALEHYKQAEWREREIQFVPHASSWLRAVDFSDFGERTETLFDEPDEKPGHPHWCEECAITHSWICLDDPICFRAAKSPCGVRVKRCQSC